MGAFKHCKVSAFKRLIFTYGHESCIMNESVLLQEKAEEIGFLQQSSQHDSS